MRPPRLVILFLALHGILLAVPLRAQDGVSGDAYPDDRTRSLHEAARSAWGRIERDVLSYTAVVSQRAAAQLRLPLRDRTLYHEEVVSRVFWSRDGEAVVQVLGAREWTVGRREPEADWGSAMVFDPAGDRLSFGMPLQGQSEAWFHHPLGRNAAEHYRFRAGDSLTLSLPDGRRLRALELQVLPREANFRRISGSLWIEPESGALVRAVYRLSRSLDVLEAAREDGEDVSRFVPGLFRPFTFDVTLIAVDYAFWDFKAWLPRSMRVEGMVRAGIVKVPGAVDMSYRMESVVTGSESAEGGGPSDGLEHRHFRTRSEALAYLAELMAEAGAEFELDESTRSARSGRTVRYVLPEDRSFLVRSPHLPPPVWRDAPGFADAEELRDFVGRLAALPQALPSGPLWTASWGLQRPDLVRYNRVEGLALGARLEALAPTPFGPVTLGLQPFLGVSDRSLKGRLYVDRETLRGRFTAAAYRELEAASREGRHLGLGNSLQALLFGRDDGEYFRATGVDLRWSPPSARRRSWEVRLHAERQEPVETAARFSLAHAFDRGWSFRPNLASDRQEEVGASVLASPWWGADPMRPQGGLELLGQGALGTRDWARAAVTLRGTAPLLGGALRLGAEVGAGEGWGDLPLQRNWFLGGAGTLRGYPASTSVGPSFARARLELARAFPAWSLALFGDAGWAGDGLGSFESGDALHSVGAGLSLLDGVIRLDAARALRGERRWRWDLYLDGIL